MKWVIILWFMAGASPAPFDKSVVPVVIECYSHLCVQDVLRGSAESTRLQRIQISIDGRPSITWWIQ